MKQRKILFTGVRQVEVVEEDLPPLGANQVLVRSEVSLMSTGTENICFNHLFAPGTHWEQFLKYPYEPGYSVVGIAEEVGSEVKGIKVGDRIAHQKGHSNYHVVDEQRCFPVPNAVLPEDAVWVTLGQITHNGARCAGFHLGDRIAVVGAGPIGQMSLRWAVASGAEETVAIDSLQSRLDIATMGGATHTIAAPVSDAKPIVAELLRGLPDVVVDATGHASVFEHALRLVKTQGRVLVIGDTGAPGEQRLTGDLVTRAITVHGAHGQTTFQDRNFAGIAQLFFRLVSSGRFSLNGMNTHRFSPDNAEDAYRLANESRDETMGILFRW